MTLTVKIENIIKGQFEGEGTGHDWYHIQRVLHMSRYIQTIEGGNLEIIELAALLHDISDHKFNGGKLDEGGKVAFQLLTENGCAEPTAEAVKYIVDNISFKGANSLVEMNTLEGKIVQDADRLDAIGAIGIARTFAYGGSRNQPIYEPQHETKLHETFEEYVTSKSNSINHFYEKLLLLRDRLNTQAAIEIGNERHYFMVNFLDEFHKEWNFNL